jgi:hypothetical protein
MEQIEVLLRHATENSNIDEARNAAYALAKLIKKHNLLIVRAPSIQGTTFPPPTARPAPARPAKAPPPKAPTGSRPVDGTPKSASHEDWQKMKAKFAGYCKWCRKPIKPNSPIYWSRDHGAYHPICFVQSS